MTNVSGDHFDAFPGGLEEYQQAFAEFLGLIPETGTLILHQEDADALRLAEYAKCEHVNADEIPLPELSIPGSHMQANAQLVQGLAQELGIDSAQAAASLQAFSGTWRRSEVKGEWQLSTGDAGLVIDDYGHHPNEISVTLQALKDAYPDRRIICVFQPHTHDRTRRFYDDIIKCFKPVDVVLMPGIYDARHDIETYLVDETKLVDDIAKASDVEAIHTDSFSNAEDVLKKDVLQAGDLLVTMGAGDDLTAFASQMTARD
jgi:UDP-N-acetylmuramate--alanine ligase